MSDQEASGLPIIKRKYYIERFIKQREDENKYIEDQSNKR
jgi:hypothetical protein